MGSKFPNQGSNLGPWQLEAQSPNHWMAREVLDLPFYSSQGSIPGQGTGSRMQQLKSLPATVKVEEPATTETLYSQINIVVFFFVLFCFVF